MKRKTIKILIILGILLFLGFVSSFSYWYLTVRPIQEKERIEKIGIEKARQEAERTLEEWLSASLKPEFLPPKLNIELGVDIGGGVTLDENTYGYNWHYLGKDFYTAIDYNDNKIGINFYVLAVFLDEKIELDQEVVPELLENYFNLPRPDLKCEIIKIGGEVINSCQGNWRDKKENWHNISAVSTEKNEESWTMFIYYLTSLESETYGEKPF